MGGTNNLPRWKKIILPCNPAFGEIISAEVIARGAEGVEELPSGLAVYLPEPVWNEEWKNWLLNRMVFLDKEFNRQALKEETIVWQDWTESWKKNFESFRIEPGIVIAPDWEMPEIQRGEHLIRIAPKMAFGTGHHETTRLILSLLPRYVKPGCALLDAGTGSGILAILAARLSAGKIVAFDNDAVAIENARENAGLNGVANHIEFFTGQLADLQVEKFDLITANINRNVLLRLSEDWQKYATDDTVLVLSGLLMSDAEIVTETYNKEGWQVFDKKSAGEWMALSLRPAKIAV